MLFLSLAFSRFPGRTVAVPALQALLAGLARPSEAGALLGALGSMNELAGAICSSMYAAFLAAFATDLGDSSDSSCSILSAFRSMLPVEVPGMHFVVGGAFAFAAFAVASGLNRHKDHPALSATYKSSS